MDDHPPTVSQDSSSADAEPLLDSVTAELKAEFARLNREAAPDEPSNRSDVTYNWITSNRHSPRAIERRTLCRQVGQLQSFVTTLIGGLVLADSISGLRQELQFWVAALESTLEALAKLSALFAHSLQAALRTPLFLDGPELSGYKHRLR